MSSIVPPNFENYLETLRRSGLVKGNDLDAVVQRVTASGETSDCNPLARKLMEEELITSWQHAHLVEGRHKGFFLGNYKLLRLLGSGGMGAVYVAEHTFMHRRVAVKVLYEAQVDRVGLERFYLECRAIASLDHPNIVRAHDFDSNGEFLYLVMEFIDGPDLHALVQKRGQIPFAEAAGYIRQAADGLNHAHSAGMVHRDIKPANLLRDPKGVIKILDLGLARITHRDEKALTLAANAGVLGTVDFLAPEQAVNSHNVDHRADIYSLGCTLYFLLAGRPPFPEGSVAQKLMAHQVEEPVSITTLRPDAPPDLIALLKKMMAKKAEKRISTAVEVSQLLAPWEKWKASDTATASHPPTVTVKSDTKPADGKVHLRCDGCRTVFRATLEKADKLKQCPKCGAKLVRQT